MTMTFRKLGVALVAAAGLVTTGLTAEAQTRLQGAGATFPNPLYQRWVAEYQNVRPNVRIDYQSIGSGGGIKGITDKTVDFAGSDAPMSKKELAAAGGAENIVEIPSAAGGVVAAFNVPGVTALNLTGEALADIFMGKITKWNDAKLAELNPGVALPDTSITPVYRTDGSGTTFVWTNYLATQSDAFRNSVGMGKQVKFPLGQGGKGNEGVTAAVKGTAGAIGYVEANYATANKLAFASIRNRDGKLIKASPETISAAGAGAAATMDGNILAADIWNQPGENAYPAAAFTYLIVYQDLSNLKSKEQAQALADFLWWATHDGQKLAAELDYAPLAPEVVQKVEAALRSLTYKGEKLSVGAR